MRSTTPFLIVSSLAAALMLVTGCESSPDNVQHSAVGKSVPAKTDAPAPDFEAATPRVPTARTLYTMARILETQGKESESEYVLRKIVREHPDFAPAYCDLAETLLRQRRLDEAERTLHAGLAVSPRDAVLTNDLGMCKLSRGDFEQALVRFTKAAGIAPDDARFRSNMAVALGMLGRYSESLALYQLILPQHEAHYNLGVLCDARHDSIRAAREFHEAQVLRAAFNAKQASASETDGQRISASPFGSSEMKSPATTRPTG